MYTTSRSGRVNLHLATVLLQEPQMEEEILTLHKVHQSPFYKPVHVWDVVSSGGMSKKRTWLGLCMDHLRSRLRPNYCLYEFSQCLDPNQYLQQWDPDQYIHIYGIWQMPLSKLTFFEQF